jgi:hypothetical protein
VVDPTHKHIQLRCTAVTSRMAYRQVAGVHRALQSGAQQEAHMSDTLASRCLQIVHQLLDAEPADDGKAGSSGSSQASDTSPQPRISYFLDGAHTPESMATCAHWFASACQPAPPNASVQRVLIFNCMQAGSCPLSTCCSMLTGRASTPLDHAYTCCRFHTASLQGRIMSRPVLVQERDPVSLLTPLIQTLRQRQALPQHALFVVPDSSYMSLAKRVDQAAAPDTSWQQQLARIWQQKVAPTAEGAAAGAQNGSAAHVSAANGSAASSGAAAGPPASNGKTAALPQLLGQDTRRGVAVPSLADTVRWLHRCAREQPRRQLQVRTARRCFTP